MYSPLVGPGFAVIRGALPVPIERVVGYVFKHHSRDKCLAISLERCGSQCHFTSLELTGKKQIPTLIIYPGLLPALLLDIINRNAVPVKFAAWKSEFFLNDTVTQDFSNRVRSVTLLTFLPPNCSAGQVSSHSPSQKSNCEPSGVSQGLVC